MEYPVAPPGDDENTGPHALEAIGGLFTSIAIILVILRFYVRARMVKKLWWDDFFLLIGMLFSMVGSGASFAMMYSGIGRHLYHLSYKQISFVLRMGYIELPISILSLMFTKLSICCFLLRIFITKRTWNSRVWKRAMYIIIAVIVALNLSSAVLLLPQCKPIARMWNPLMKGTCWPEETVLAIGYYQGATSTFTDFLLAFLPIHFLKDLQISKRKKLSICALMSLGIFTGICAVARTVAISQVRVSDITYSLKSFELWGGLERNVAIIAAALPALRPLWAKSARVNQKPSGPARWAEDQRRLKSIPVVMDQQSEPDSLPSQIEPCVLARGGGDHVPFAPDRHGIMTTSDVGMEMFRKDERRWFPDHSSLSDRERSVTDVV